MGSPFRRIEQPSSVLFRSRFLREWVKILLVFVVIYNFGLLATALIATFTAEKVDNVNHRSGYLGIYFPSNHRGEVYYETWKLKIARFFYFNAIPLVLCVASSVQLFLWWRRSLSAKHVLVSSFGSLVICALAETIWTVCVYTYPLTKWCPIRSYGWRTPFVWDAYYILPWLLILSFLSYGLLFIVGATSFRRDYMAKRQQANYTTDFNKEASLASFIERYPSLDDVRPTPRAPEPVMSDTGSMTDGAPSTLRTPSKRSVAVTTTTLPAYDVRSSYGSRFAPNGPGIGFCSHCGQMEQ